MQKRLTPGKLIAALVAAIVLAVIAPRSGLAAADAGSVLAAAGQSFVTTGGQRNALKMGDAVHVGDTVNVSAGAKLKLRMNDGTVLSIAAGTQLTIQAYGSDAAGHRDAELNLSGGLLRAVVASVTQPAVFEVNTATGVAAVRSTDLFVRALPGSTQVGVLAGTVSLDSRATHRSVTIPARWGARVEAGRDPVPARVWTAQEFNEVIQLTTLN